MFLFVQEVLHSVKQGVLFPPSHLDYPIVIVTGMNVENLAVIPSTAARHFDWARLYESGSVSARH
jgi:hypothetical protein